MNMIIRLFILTTAVIFHSTATATIKVQFIESAPKDSFVITNNSNAVLENITLTLDLSSSAGNLIFDTSASGAGVEVFQPFELSKGTINLSKGTHQDGVEDGEQVLVLNIPTL